ncbi:MAG TPA: hybrid sensor histidine kinase/response regulator [Terriglobales bacterium]|nr:hybrid sensor histidine kinase/response regulator [Terriglobales bacterium]
MSDRTTRALLVEDNPGDAFLVQEQLSQARTAFAITATDHLSAAMESISSDQPDVVLLDLDLPDSRGTDTIRKIVQKVPNVPVLVLTGRDDEELAVRAVQEGAQDYLLKTHLDGGHLARAIRYAIERQSLLRALHQSREQQLHFKDQLLSHVSHELRSPLSCIYQFVTIVLDGLSGPVTTEQRECLETILKSANQLRSMIDDLLETATIEAGKLRLEFRCVALRELVEQAIQMLQAAALAKGVALRCEIQAAPLLVHGDPHRILQILLNLIENAIKFTPERGSVSVLADIFVEDQTFAQISVQDTGCGIGERAKALVFERLYQEQHDEGGPRKGLGLGLSICKELVASHGGKLWVESQLGCGSTFYFTLPVFSLSKLIYPVAVENGVLRPEVSLLTVKLAPIPVTAAIDAWGKSRKKCLELLERCILPDKDVLLPSMGQLEMGEFFFILAAADQVGANVMLKRIREQVSRHAELPTHTVLNASAQTLSTSALPQCRNLERRVDELSGLIGQRVMETLEKGRSNNG